MWSKRGEEKSSKRRRFPVEALTSQITGIVAQSSAILFFCKKTSPASQIGCSTRPFFFFFMTTSRYTQAVIISVERRPLFDKRKPPLFEKNKMWFSPFYCSFTLFLPSLFFMFFELLFSFFVLLSSNETYQKKKKSWLFDLLFACCHRLWHYQKLKKKKKKKKRVRKF